MADQYRVFYNGHIGAFGLKEFYETGENVEVRVPVMTDVSTYVTSEEVQLGAAEIENGYYAYRFVMPEKDVHISVETVSMMMNPYYNGSGNLPFGFMGMGNMQELMNRTEAPENSGEQKVKKKRFCPECGFENSSENRFCTNCGYRLD